jgi:ribosomal protein S10
MNANKKYKIILNFKNINYYNLLSDCLVLKRYLIKNFFNINLKLSAAKGQKKKITILKSPFVYKKSQEHFFINHYNYKIYLHLPFFVYTIFQNQ